MFNFQKFKHFFHLFYIFGQAPYIPYRNRSKKSSLILMFIPFKILILFLIASSYLLFSTHFQSITKSDSVVWYFITFITYAPNVTVIYETIVQPHAVIELIQRITFVARFAETKLKGNPCDEKFKSFYLRDVSILFVLSVLTIVIRFAIKTPVYGIGTEMAISMMQVYKEWAMVHTIFYLHFIRILLLSINSKIGDQEFESMIMMCDVLGAEFQRSKSNAMNYLHHLRFYHLKLWEVVMVFNRRFGWTIIGIIFDKIVAAGNSIYWIFIYLSSSSFERPIILAWRKYLIS